MVWCMESLPTLTAIDTLDNLTKQLRAWDWYADLVLEERSIPWLARKTGKSQRSVYSYKYKQARPSDDWLRDAYRVLRGG